MFNTPAPHVSTSRTGKRPSAPNNPGGDGDSNADPSEPQFKFVIRGQLCRHPFGKHSSRTRAPARGRRCTDARTERERERERECVV